MEMIVGKTQVILEKGDITKYAVDAVVNAANSALVGGGGVDGAIHSAGGRAIGRACRELIGKIGRLDTGKAVITTAGELPAKNIIHTVGPIYQAGSKTAQKLLAAAYRNSLTLADDMALASVAFPSISTGAFRYPVEEAAETAMTAIREYLEQPTKLEKVYMVLYSDQDLDVYIKAFQKVISGGKNG